MSLCCSNFYKMLKVFPRKGLGIVFVFWLCSSHLVFSETETPKKPIRDPMMPTDMSIFEVVQKKVIRRSPFKIQGVVRSDKDSYVIIGGKVYREGGNRGEI